MNNDTKRSIETLLLHKGGLVKNRKAYRKQAKEILRKQRIRNNVDAFVMGAVDAMIYDIASSLGLIRQKSYKKRKEIIDKLWSKQKYLYENFHHP